MNAFLKFVTYPFRAGIEFADRRPSLVLVKDHLQKVEPIMQVGPDGISIILVAKDADVELRTLTSAYNPAKCENAAEAYTQGVAAGWHACSNMVVNARVSTIAKDNRKIKAAIKEEQQARQERAEQAECETFVPMPGAETTATT